MSQEELSRLVYAAAMFSIIAVMTGAFGLMYTSRSLHDRVGKTEREFDALRDEVINFHDSIRQWRTDTRKSNDIRFKRLEEHTGYVPPDAEAA